MKILRRWQKQARDLIADRLRDLSSGNNTILIEAGIGSGKTLTALVAARDALDKKQIGRVIVVTFTSHLVRQWGKVATIAGLNLLESRGGNGALKDGFPVDAQGYITTFASVSSLSDIHEANANSLRTMVIIDEIHHLGEEDEISPDPNKSMTKWAEDCYAAFKNSRFVVALSGTPYRTDNKQIPFVEYHSDTYRDMYLLKSDIQYSYGESVADGICRRVVFETLDGPVNLDILLSKDGQIVDRRNEIVRFEDNIEREKWHERLAAALKIDNEYKPISAKNQLLIDIIRKANNKLNDLRVTDPRAGGLLIADNKDHARKLRAVLKAITGQDAILILEDVEKASDLIEAYRDGSSPWIIAVNMVAEGVDIPRLRV